MIRVPRWCVLLCALGACEPAAESPGAPPPLPALELRPFLGRLNELSTTGPQPPAESRLVELRELMEVGFLPGQSGVRLAARAEKDLLEAEDAFWVLEEGLEHENATVRSKAAFHLGEHGHQASLLKLLRRLKYEKEPTVLIWVAQALHKLGNHAGLPQLSALMSLAETANDAGLAALEICKSSGLEVLDAPSYAWIGQQLDALYRDWQKQGLPRAEPPATAPAVEPLTTARIAAHLAFLESLQLRPVDDAKYILTRAGTLAVPLLSEAVTAQEPYLRNGCLLILQDLGRAASGAGDAVLPLLGDPLSAAGAARTLGALGSAAAGPHLRAMLDDTDTERRAAAAFALGPLGDTGSASRLKAMMGNGEESMDVRVAAAFSLAVFELQRPALRFLEERRAAGEYHEATIDELIDRVDRYR